jgi:hypothetical protein
VVVGAVVDVVSASVVVVVDGVVVTVVSAKVVPGSWLLLQPEASRSRRVARNANRRIDEGYDPTGNSWPYRSKPY